MVYWDTDTERGIMPSTTPQERLRTLSLTSLMVIVTLAIALVTITFKFHDVEEMARKCHASAAAGYWQHVAVQSEATNQPLSDQAGQTVASQLDRVAAQTIGHAFTECDTRFSASNID